MTACTICSRELTADEDGWAACRYCTDQIRAWLNELPGQHTELQECLDLVSAPRAGRVGGTGRAHSPLPLRLDSLNLLAAGASLPVEDPHGDQSGGIPITAVLHGWAHHITYEIGWAYDRTAGRMRGMFGVDGPAPHRGGDIAGWCAWLLAYLPYAATRPWVVTMYEELDSLLREVRQITALTPRRHPMDAPCPGCQAFALVAVDGERYIHCEACPQLLTWDEYLEHRGRVMPPLARLALLMVAAQATAAAAGETGSAGAA